MASDESRPTLDTECMLFTIDCDTCQKTLVFDRAKDERYRNWIYATLCIQWTKEALENLVQDIAKQMHADIKPDLSNALNCSCMLKDFTKDKLICKFCTILKNRILERYLGERKSFKWKVSLTIKQMHDSEMNLFKLFVLGKCEGCTNLKEVDCAALLSYLEFTANGRMALNSSTAYLTEVRKARNELMHSGTMRIEENQLKRYGYSCLVFLENVQHPSEESKGIADKKYNDIKMIMDKKIFVGFVEAEEVAMEHVHSHAKVEIETLQKEIESGDLSPQEIRKKKEKLSKVKDDLIKRGTVMEAMNMPSTNTKDVKKLVEDVQDVYKKAEEKQNDVSTKLEHLQSEMTTMFQNLDTKIETEVGRLKTGIDTLQEKVISLEQLNQNKDRQKSVLPTVENCETFKLQQSPVTSNLSRQDLTNIAVHDERSDNDYSHDEEVDITKMKKLSSNTRDEDDQDISGERNSINKYSTKVLSEKSIENDEEEDISVDNINDSEKDGTTDIVTTSCSIDGDYYGDKLDADGAYDRVCKTIHAKLEHLHESELTPIITLAIDQFPLRCEKDGCFCLHYSDLLWNTSILAYHTFESESDEEVGTSIAANHTTIFGMYKQDLESFRKIEILGFANELEKIIAKKDIGSVYFVNSQEKCFFAAVYLSIKKGKDLLQNIFPDTRSIKMNADILIFSAYLSPFLAMEISEYMMSILSDDDKIQNYRKTLYDDSKDTIYEIQTLLIEALNEMLRKKYSNARLHINDIIVLPTEVSNIVSLLDGMTIKNLKSVVLEKLDREQTTQILKTLDNIPLIKMKLVDCEVGRRSDGYIVRDSLCVLDLLNLSISHEIFGTFIRQLSALKLLKFIRLHNLACSDHGQVMDDCEGLVVDFTGFHKQLEAVWIIKCPLSEIAFNESAEQLQKIYLSEVKSTDTCLKYFWESLPPRSVAIWLWDVTIVLSGRNTNIINEMRQSNESTITHDEGDKEENGNLIVERLELKKQPL